MIGLSWMKRKLRDMLSIGAGALAGIGFMVLAGVAIQFEEGVGQKLAHFSNGATDLGRKLFSL
jgi:hypothetical protein